MDLSLVPYDDLITELNSRFDVCIFAGVKKPDDKIEEASLSYHGGKFACIGLCQHLINMLLLECKELIQFKEKE